MDHWNSGRFTGRLADRFGRPAECRTGCRPRALEERRYEKARIDSPISRGEIRAMPSITIGLVALFSRDQAVPEAVKSMREAARIDPAQPNVYLHRPEHSALGTGGMPTTVSVRL